MVVDPFHDLIQGVLQGHALAQQLRNESQQQEMYQRSLVRDQQDSQMRDMQAQQMLTQYGRPVTGNMVQDTTTIPDPDTPGQVKTVPFPRPVDKSRLMSYTKSDGSTLQAERYTPDEFATRAAKMQLAGQRMEAFGGADIADQILQQYGIAPPAEAVRMGLAPAGRKVTPKEFQELQSKVYELNKPTIVPQGAAAISGLNAGAPPQPAEAPGAAPPAPNTPTPFGSGAQMVGAPTGGSAPVTATPPGPLPPPFAGIQDKRDGNRQTFKNAANAAGGRVLYQNPEKQTQEEKTLDKYASAYTNLDGTPKTWKDLTPDEVDKVRERNRIHGEDPNLRSLTIASKQAADSSRQLSDALKQQTLTNKNAGAAGVSVQAPSELTGDAYLATLPGWFASEVKNTALGIEQPTARTVGGQAAMAKLVQAVHQYDRDYDPGTAQFRKKTIDELGSTTPSSLGGQKIAINTMIHHADLYLDVANALKNHDFTPANAAYNKFATIFGKAAPNDAGLVSQFLAGEGAKLATSGVPGEQEVGRVLEKLKPELGPDQIAGAGNTLFQLAGGRAQPLTERLQEAKLEGKYHMLGPSARAILTRRGFDPDTLKPLQGGQAGGQAGPALNPAAQAAAQAKLQAKLPKGNGRVATPDIFTQYQAAYGNDNAKALAALAKDGWK